MLYKEDLMVLGCNHPGCKYDHTVDDTVFFHARCHPDAPVWAFARNGSVYLECSVCKQGIAGIAVASKENPQ